MKLQKNFWMNLFLLLNGILLSMTSLCQSGNSIRCVTKEHYDSVLTALTQGRQAQLDLLTYEIENDTLRSAVGEKNSLILQLKQQIALQQRIIDSFAVVARVFNSGIYSQGKVIEGLKRAEKRFAFTLGGGYGYSLGTEIKRVPYIGASFGFILFKL